MIDRRTAMKSTLALIAAPTLPAAVARAHRLGAGIRAPALKSGDPAHPGKLLDRLHQVFRRALR